MPGIDFQNIHQRSVTASTITGQVGTGGINELNITATSATHGQIDYEFSPVGEIRLQANYQVTRSVALKIGYTLLYVDGISRGANRIEYTLPRFGILGSPSNEEIFAQGLNLGIEVNR